MPFFKNFFAGPQSELRGPKYKQRDKKAKAKTRQQKQSRRLNRKIMKTQ